MACRLIVLILALFSVPAFSTERPKDPPPVQQHWKHEGGQEHFFISGAAGLACSQVFTDSFGKAWACAMVPGTVKELLDASDKGNKFSAEDMAFNALGAALGVTAGHWALRRANGQTLVTYSTRF